MGKFWSAQRPLLVHLRRCRQNPLIYSQENANDPGKKRCASPEAENLFSAGGELVQSKRRTCSKQAENLFIFTKANFSNEKKGKKMKQKLLELAKALVA